jgi:hypothetical protein
MIDQNSDQQILIYQADSGETQIDVLIEEETIWLNLVQIAELFGRDKSVISRHLNNIFSSGELGKDSTVAKNATVQTEGHREVTRSIVYFNLDAILSVGYRVNSKKGTQFRIWASNVLKQYLVQGYALNERKLQAEQEKLNDLKRAIALSSRLLHNRALTPQESQSILSVLEKYSNN